MDYKHVEKDQFNGKKVKILAESYEPGSPETIGCGKDPDWRGKLVTRENKLNYLKTAERYWYSTDWFGSEGKK